MMIFMMYTNLSQDERNPSRTDESRAKLLDKPNLEKGKLLPENDVDYGDTLEQELGLDSSQKSPTWGSEASDEESLSDEATPLKDKTE